MQWLPSLVDDTESPPGDAARRALGRLTSSVTILTVSRGGLVHGATASVVLPLSRRPPAVGVSLRASSGFSAMALAERLFSVNVLASDQAPLAIRFAAPGRASGDAQFAGVDWTADRVTGAPLLRDCTATLSCRVSDCIQVGDHNLIVADVIAGSAGVGDPLLAYPGRLGQLRKPAVKHEGVAHRD